MDVNVKYSLGLLFLFGFLLNIYAQECTEIPNCKICGELGGVLSCLECDENFAQYNQKCCSKGCNTDFEGKHACDLDRGGICLFDSCLNTYYGDYCQPCSERIQNCDDCDLLKDTEVVQCTHCVSDFYLTANGQQCCPQGCASCTGTDGRTCTSCKQSYFLYNNSCDTCGNNCIPPTDGSARCDPDTGACYLGCRDGWHGRRCNVQCNLDNCVKCNYNEAADLLTCSDCIDGRYGINCDLCSANCAPSPQGNADICYQDGSCKHGCNKGYQGARCDVRCDGPIDMANCTVCERYSFLCTECKPGHWGQKCQYSCDSNCVGFQGNRLCAIADGTCDLGCLAGHYKANCSGSCPNCGQDVCNRDTGNCLDLICDPGFYGPACNSTCPVNCAPNPVTGNAYCDFTNGSCEYGCGDGYWGTFCNRGCSIHCAQSPSAVGTVTRPPCIQETGTCRYDCTPGYFGHDCLKNCISQCVDGTCDINSGQCEECNKGELAGPQCPFGNCDVGMYGKFCNLTCPGGAFCKDSLCNRNTSSCLGCISGYFGQYCDKNCSRCENGECYQENGTCIGDCIQGFFGSKCNQFCHKRCTVCNRITGNCEICNEGTYGAVCESNCSYFCFPSDKGIITCSKSAGECDQNRCLAGYYTSTCNAACNEYCYLDECDFVTGRCLYGCEIGRFGMFCDRICSDKCLNRHCNTTFNDCVEGCVPEYYGGNCNIPCSPYCFTNACDNNGICARGCKYGWYGELCDKECNSTCTDGLCDRVSGICAECSKKNPGPLCRTAKCQTGFHGSDCDMPCPSSSCNASTCERYTGTCIGCLPGLYGDFCNKTCNMCKKGSVCQQSDGKCDHGCEDGRFGPYCQQMCFTCVKCNQMSGLCTDCPEGSFGDNCTLSCSSYCEPVDGVVDCELQTGSCASAKCVDGYWGLDCFRTCNENCGVNPKTRLKSCDINSGRCNDNCTASFYGEHCNIPCESYCLDFTCHRLDGVCAECGEPEPNYNCPDAECEEGKYGQRCNLTCSTGCTELCDRYTGACTSCKPGFWQSKCDRPCTSGGSCYQCNQMSGVCEICVPGKHGFNCENDCGFCTPSEDGMVHCDKETAVCETSSCVPGYHGSTCEYSCNPTCYDSGDSVNNCQFSTGICLDGCDIGYYGHYCENECSVTCRNKDCEGSSTNCRQGCAFGYYGDNCLSPCPEQCVGGGCNEKTGACDSSCKPGFFGDQCITPCESTCIDFECDKERGDCLECQPDVNTGRQSYYCRDAACPVGKYGQFCQVNCTERCRSACGRYNGTCFGCDPGFHGNNCEFLCGVCSSGSCDQKTGLCTTDCRNGFWNVYCNETCLYDGCETCFKGNGRCDICKVGFHGTNCDRTCSVYCARNSLDQVICEKETAACDEGKCLPGYWNRPCDITCNSNCRANANGERPCSLTNGACDLGCEDTYYGQQCNSRCSVYCIDRLCERDGRCALGCIDGRYGEMCELACRETCNNGQCNRTHGECEECNKPYQLQTELCRTAACSPPKSGLFCNLTCAVNCQDGICTRYDQICNSCIDGFYGAECDIDCGNCREGKCDQGTGECVGECEEGFYTPRCTVPCIEQGCQKCDRSSGTCIECKEGLWGTECESSCSPYCFPDVRGGGIFCDRDSAHCAANSCIPGYHGRDCSQECNEHCGLSTSGYRPCNIDTGVCDEDQCDPTWYGPLCNLNCPVNCKNRNCTRTGVCVEGCVTGYWGPMCRAICQPENTCNTGTCDQGVGECLECLKDEPTPLCRDAACSPINTWGVFCENDCPQNCADGTCSRKDGTCSSCVSERYGAKCDQACPNCKSNMCYQTDGACMDGGCDDGWYTLQCMTECKHEGCKDCDRTNGECITCKDGKYGLNCTLDCQRNCAPNAAGSITCNRFSGECDVEACKVGYYGRKCDLTCSEFCLNVACDIDEGTCELCRQGWYGQRCDGQCSPRCRNNDCEVTEDNCRQGCTDGYWGGSCEKTCNANCNLKACNQQSGECLYGCVGNNYYQLACSEPCSTNCVENVCNRTGYCMRGCKTGWYGDKCQFQCQAATKCTDGTCSRIGGVCEDCFDSNPGPNCPTADCPSGLKGAACEDLCNSTNCQFNRCERYTGACIACPLGYYGSLCDKTCFRCREGSGCDQTTGICDAGCEDGWYRPDCETKCSDVCGSCERNSGECVTCAPGRWGIACELLCSTNCNATNVGGIHLVFCEKATGACLEKACKVGYWGTDCTQVCSTNCLQDSNNNRVCSYEEGKCLIGCKSTFYGDQCDSLCSPRCRDQLCTNFRDSCNLNCADGYYGATCSGTCSPHCAGQGRCNPDNGTCFEGCEIGYYGPRCLPCKNTCLDGTCDTTGGCPDCLDPIGPQCRVQVCPTGLYGTTCESNCPGDYCQNNQCHRHKGTCENGCLEKYYGAYCTERCQCYEPGIISCNHTNGECICKPGRYGTKCDQTCSPGCSGNECDRTGTCTLGCLEGRYGARCDQSCTNCLSEACGAETGICLQGCVDGWYGPQCKNPCPVECKKCDIESGKCTTCADEYFPLDLCDKTCSSNCVRVGTSRVCSQANGECLNGCKLGYYGPDCSQTCGQCNSCNSNDGSCQVCNPGWWGTTCKSQCNSHCSRGGSSNERICRQSDGYCEFGCDPGFYGDTCSSSCTGINCAGGICNRQLGTCKEGCVAYFYGENCDNRCDSCKAGVCDQVNGNCIGDCPASFYGNKCDKECKTPICNDAICNKDSGFCDDCQLSPKGPRCSVQDAVTANPITQMEADDEVLSIGAIIGITVGSVCFVIIFVIVFVCCMNYKRRYDDAKTEIHLPSDVIERLSTHRSLHSTVSTNYPVARVVGDDEKDFVLF